MNAKQRRTRYRKIIGMIGKPVVYFKPRGILTGVVLGLSRPVEHLSSNSDDSNFDGSRPSVHRVRILLDSGAQISPRISRVVFP